MKIVVVLALFICCKCSGAQMSSQSGHENYPEETSVCGVVTPQMFGAIADGKHDDTEAIRKACQIAADTLLFPKGTYIINIQAGEEIDKPRNFFYPKASNIIGEKGSVIKLEKDNGNTNIKKGYESIFSFGGKTKQVLFRGLTIDFNYKNNPIHHYSSNDVGVEVNGQQMAINVYRGATLTVDHCTFIDHSGTNCIVFRGNYEADTLACVITNCKFINTGRKSFYKGKPAYHDCSTIGIHSDKKPQKVELVAKVENNIFEGSDGNAFDACECAADRFYFQNNVVKNYVIGVMPLTCNSGTQVFIRKNTFKQVARGIGFWSCWMDVENKKDVEGFRLLQVSENIIEIDIHKSLHTPTFRTINSSSAGYYLGGTYAAICSMGNWNKSLGTLDISHNEIYYTKLTEREIEAIKGSNRYNGAVLGLFAKYNVPASQAKCKVLKFEVNKVEGAPNHLMRIAPFNKIDTLIIRGNGIRMRKPCNDIEKLISIEHTTYKGMQAFSMAVKHIENNDLKYKRK